MIHCSFEISINAQVRALIQNLPKLLQLEIIVCHILIAEEDVDCLTKSQNAVMRLREAQEHSRTARMPLL